jgi:membrane associated rhomboid family serine protease/Flp pilus assembly protein TadD
MPAEDIGPLVCRAHLAVQNDSTLFGIENRLADCRNCGKKLSFFNFGDDPHLCRACANERARQRQRFGATNRSDFFTDTLGPNKATWALLAINVIVFAAMIQAGVSPTNPEVAQLIAKGANFGPKTIGDGEYWRLVTAGFVHIGAMHLLMNAFGLWILARQVEAFFGAITTIAIYVLTAAGAELLSMSYDPYRVSAGASGPLFGIMGVLAAFTYLGKHDLTAAERSAELRSIVLVAVLNLFLGLGGGIDNMAHLGGLITGLLIGVGLSRRRREDQQRIPAAVLASAAIIISLLVVPVARAKKPAMDILKAEDAYQRQDWKTAITLLRERVSRAPYDPTAHALLGLCLERDKQIDAAMAEYATSLRLAPTLDWSRYSLVTLQLQKQDYAGAKETISPLLTREPPNSGAYLYYGQALAGLKDYRAAEEALRKSAQLEDSTEAHSSLAAVLRAQGRTKEANAEDKLAEAAKQKQGAQKSEDE